MYLILQKMLLLPSYLYGSSLPVVDGCFVPMLPSYLYGSSRSYEDENGFDGLPSYLYGSSLALSSSLIM